MAVLGVRDFAVSIFVLMIKITGLSKMLANEPTTTTLSSSKMKTEALASRH
jgi:hypothetical protein